MKWFRDGDTQPEEIEEWIEAGKRGDWRYTGYQTSPEEIAWYHEQVFSSH